MVAVLVFAVLFGGGDDDGTKERDEKAQEKPAATDSPDLIGDKWGAIVACEDFVKRNLKSPASAEFTDESVMHLDKKNWKVLGSVDSQNSFGAMIRNEFNCEVRFRGGDQWRLLSLTGLEN